LEILHRQHSVDLFDVLRRRSSRNFVDFLDFNRLVSQTTTLEYVHDLTHVSLTKSDDC
jgi:hypothetical protein